MSSRNTPLERIDAAWGLVAERLAADQKTVDALTLVLGWEQDRIDVGVVPGLPCDVAYPELCGRLGEVAGLAQAIRCLTDSDYIAERRDHIATKIKEAKQDARARS